MTNDLADWFPVIQSTGVDVPKTIIIKTEIDLFSILEGEIPIGYGHFLNEMKSAALAIGYPLFLRSGMTSAKHDWSSTCFVKKESDLEKHIGAIVEFSECCDFFGLPYNTWALRELLPTKSQFVSFSEMPITREFRYFIEGGRVICHHPYWPDEAFVEQLNSTANWPALLREMNQETPEELSELATKSELVSRSFDGAWSIDWLETERGWVAIDMASAKTSWHWPRCPKQ